MNSQRGKLIVITAPSGAGKTTLVRKLIENHPELHFSISCTTRPARPGENDGIDYIFLDTPRFEAMIAAGEFLEYAEVFGHFYGTGKAQVEQLRNAGHDVLLEIDWQGAQQVRSNQPDCRSIFVMPPSLAELEKRLRGRGTDADEVIQRRLSEATGDMSHWREFDHVVVNDDLDQAVSALESAMDGDSADTQTKNPAVRSKIEALFDPSASIS